MWLVYFYITYFKAMPRVNGFKFQLLAVIRVKI